MTDKYIMIDMDDPKTNNVADILSNKTAKKILSMLADSEMSESDIALKLNIPLNTVDYNIKKLVNAGLLEKSKQFFWSVKGKKIPLYKVSNKKIVISPKSSLRGVISTIIASGLIAVGIKYLLEYKQNTAIANESLDRLAGSAGSVASSEMVTKAGEFAPKAYYTLVSTGNEWMWFFLGALTALLIFLVWNWRKIW